MFIPISSEIRREGVPYVSLGIVLLCFVIFVFEWISATLVSRHALHPFGVYHTLFYDYALDSKRLFTTRPFTFDGWKAYFTLFSHGFLHGGWFHLFFNMLFLFGFASRLEKRLGHLVFALFYLATLVMCGFLVAVYHEHIIQRRTILIGASGAVSAVMGAFLVKFPHERIHTVVWIIVRIWVMRLSAWFLVGFFILSNLINFLRSSPNGSQISFVAHLLGFASGILLIWAFTGFGIESQASPRKGKWNEGYRSFKAVLSDELRMILVLFVAIPLLTFTTVFLLTYWIRSPYHWLLWRHGDSFSTRSRLTYILILDYLPLVLLGLALLGAVVFAWWKHRVLRRALSDQQHCLWCQSSNLQLKEDEIGYTCRRCGFDSDIEQIPAHQQTFQMLREAQITLQFLQEAQQRVTLDQTQSAMFALDDERLKETFGAWGEAYEVFRDFLQRHEAALLVLLPSPLEENEIHPTPAHPQRPPTPQDIFSRIMRKGLQADASALDGADGYLREQKKLLADAIGLIEHIRQHLRQQLSPLLQQPALLSESPPKGP